MSALYGRNGSGSWRVKALAAPPTVGKTTRVILGQMEPNRRWRSVPIVLRALSSEIRAGGKLL